MNSRKKVLFIITKSNFGGAQRYVYDLATHVPADMEVVVACGPAPDGNPGELIRRLHEKNVRTILVPELQRDMHLPLDIRAYRALRKIIEKERPDVVHLSSSKAGGLGSLAARRAHIRNIIFTLHGFPSDEERPLLERILIYVATWFTILLAHTTITTSFSTGARARRMPGNHTVVIPAGIETPQFLDALEARKVLRERDSSIPEEAYWIGSIGELHPNKGYHDLIQALTHLPPDMHAIVIGSGELHDTLKKDSELQKTSDRFHLVGHLPNAAVYMRAFDCFVLPSHKEGLPYVLLEAGFGNLPVIATNVGDVGDVITEETGLRIPSGDINTLVEALKRVQRDTTESRRLAQNLLKHVQRTFSFETMLEKTYALYRV